MSVDVNALMLAKSLFFRRGKKSDIGKIVEAKIVGIDFNKQEVIVAVPWIINWDIWTLRLGFGEYGNRWALSKSELE